MTHTTQKMLVRLPDDIQRWLEAEADKNFSSKNSEIVRAIRERMERMQPHCPVVALPSQPAPLA